MTTCNATCGHCGACEPEPEESPRFECAWCGDEADDAEYFPYCSPLCSVRADIDSEVM